MTKKTAIYLVVAGFVAFVIYYIMNRPSPYTKYGEAFRKIITPEQYYDLHRKYMRDWLKDEGKTTNESWIEDEITKQIEKQEYENEKDYKLYEMICELKLDSQIDPNLLEQFAFSIPKPDAV